MDHKKIRIPILTGIDRFDRMAKELSEIALRIQEAMTRLIEVSHPNYANKYYKKIKKEAHRQMENNNEYIIWHLNEKARELEMLNSLRIEKKK